MVSSRFYRPKIASLTRTERDFIETAREGGLLYFIPDDDDPIMTRNIADKTDRYQITYNFSMATRQNVFLTVDGKKRKYGVNGISFRLLYEFLCLHFNAGEYFIDTYFSQIFDRRQVHDEFEQLNDKIDEAVEEEKAAMLEKIPLKANGTPDMRYRVSKLFMNFAFWQRPIVRSECSRVAEEIREDIIRCLSTGEIPLRKQAVSKETAKVREKMPSLNQNQFFYASGSLIKALSIYVELKR